MVIVCNRSLFNKYGWMAFVCYFENSKGTSMTQTEALRLALEALEWSKPHADAELTYQEAITAIKAALEAKDEPVAWRDAAIRLGEELSSVGPNGYYDMDAKEWLDWAIEQNPRGKHSLPQRTWVGLTDEDEIDWEEGGNLKDLVKAIEAKLKQKNGNA
jgi:hypothetical protein